MESMRVKGLDNLLKAMKELPRNVASNVTRQAVYQGAVLIRDKARDEAPKLTGTLKKAIRASRSRGSRDQAQAKVFIKPLTKERRAKLKSMGAKGRTSSGKYKGDAYYAFIVHKGAKPHRLKAKNRKALFGAGFPHPVKWVQHPGSKPNPFLKRGWESGQMAALEKIRSHLAAGIDVEANKLRNK